jgi:glutathione S-transferase
MVNKLYYFDFDGGAGEPIRNALRIAGVAFEDIRVKHDSWPELKSSDKCLFGQMPLLEVDGHMYAQSMSILRYVGKLTGLYPIDPLEALRVDELLDCIIDIRTKISPTYALPEPERIAARQKLAESFIKPHLKKMDWRVSGNASKGYAVGNKLTIADIAIANEISGFKSGRLDGIDSHIADEMEHLWHITETVKAALQK